MAKPTTKSKPSSRRSARTSGLTVLELLVAAAISLLVMGAAFAVTMSSRKLMQADQSRTGANQNLRAALDIIGNDVRLAGERLSSKNAPSIPAVEIEDGDELVLRRNVLENVLPVCRDTNATASGVQVSLLGTSRTPALAHCDGDSAARDPDSDRTPDDLEAWRDYRLEQRSSKTKAYIFVKARGGEGEYFTYSGELRTENQGHLVSRGGGGWSRVYRVSEQASVYILDERRYRLRDGVLELIVNDDETDIMKVVNGVENFQIRAKLKDDTFSSSLSGATAWKDIASIQISLTVGGRTLTSEYFPRNILSY